MQDVVFQRDGEGVVPYRWLQTGRVSEQHALMACLSEKGIQTQPFWVPMNRLPMYVYTLMSYYRTR